MEVIRPIIKQHSNDLSIDLTLVDHIIDTSEKNISLGTSIEEVLQQLSLSCSDKTISHPQWSLLAGRLQMEIIQRKVPSSFSAATAKMKSILDPDYYKFVLDNTSILDSIINTKNDYIFGSFAISTLIKSYLAHLKISDESILVETPQYMYLRVATYLHYPNIERIRKTYTNLSEGNYSHATPTLFNCGMRKPQLASCFLGSVSDEMPSITKAWHDQAIISMNSGGLGYDYNQLRHSEIGQHGFSRGIVPWLKITNEILKTVDQAGRRKGSGTIYLRDWHVDVPEFIELRDEGPEDMRAKDLFLGLMISDLFMKRVKEGSIWSLFCPNKVKGLSDKWGADFEMTYIAAENAGLYSKQINARDLYFNIINMQIKKGMPFMLYMDPCNRKSNQKNSGTIRCSNLCTEILEVTNSKEIASCTLASVCLSKCISYGENGTPYFDFEKLGELVTELVRNLNNVIDRNYYSPEIPEIKYSNMRHRPIAVGVQGLADAFAMLDISWIAPNPNRTRPEPEDAFVASEKAKLLNDQIFECIYYSAVKESIELAKEEGAYETFPGSPASQGLFQFDMWEDERNEKNLPLDFNIESCKKKSRLVSLRKKSRFTDEQWETLRREMMKYGLRNSLLVALMPTASSAHILDNMESMEPFTELIYARTVLSGQFMIVNKHLVKDLEKLGLWTTETVKNIISNRGSIALLPNTGNEAVDERISFLKLKYATAFEIPQKVLVDLSADRAEYIDQTQSFNCHIARPTKEKMAAYHFYCWSKGLKTGMYYLRQKALFDPINFSLDTIVVSNKSDTQETPSKRFNRGNVVCTDDVCLSCGS